MKNISGYIIKKERSPTWTTTSKTEDMTNEIPYCCETYKSHQFLFYSGKLKEATFCPWCSKNIKESSNKMSRQSTTG